MDKNDQNILNQIKIINNHLFFLGTMHIHFPSAQKVIEIIHKIHPHLILLELDEMRYQELIQKQNDQKRNNSFEQTNDPTLIDINTPNQFESKPSVGENIEDSNKDSLPNPKKTLFDLLYNLQNELGQIFQIIPGYEMIVAVKTAQEENIRVKFIDRPILDTFLRMQQLDPKIKNEENEIMNQIEKDPISKEDIHEIMEELKDPAAIRKMINEFKTKYPQLFNVIISERNEYMCDQIILTVNENPHVNILIITGAGHVEELIQLVYEKIKPL